jgi:hypothetical protein
MTASVLTRRIALMVAAVALCVAAAGCVSDTEAATSKTKKSSSPAQLRYQGGPKSPMWRSQ